MKCCGLRARSRGACGGRGRSCCPTTERELRRRRRLRRHVEGIVEPLPLPELRPGKEAETQGAGGGVEAVERVFELEFAWAVPLGPAAGEQLLEELLIQRGWPGGVGMGQRGMGRGADAEMGQLSAAGAQAVADLPQAFRLDKMEVEHRDALVPTGERLAVAVGPRRADQTVEGRARHRVQELREQAGIISHGMDSSDGRMLHLYHTPRKPVTLPPRSS